MSIKEMIEALKEEQTRRGWMLVKDGKAENGKEAFEKAGNTKVYSRLGGHLEPVCILGTKEVIVDRWGHTETVIVLGPEG